MSFKNIGTDVRAKEINKEVFVANESIVSLQRQDIEELKRNAPRNDRKRVRFCAHGNIDDVLHEMFIILTQDTYIRPHKHLNKAESLHVIEGACDVVFFDDHGNITNLLSMGEYASGCSFYYRISNDRYHTLIIRTKRFVFHEATTGPFRRSDTILAPWAPDETDRNAAADYINRLNRRLSLEINGYEHEK